MDTAKSKVSFLHYGYLCPWTETSLENIRKYSQHENFDFECFDISSEEAKFKGPCVFPFNTAVNGEIITGSPLLPHNIPDLFKRSCHRTVETERELPAGTVDAIKLINDQTIKDTISVCTNGSSLPCQKQDWYLKNKDALFGFVAYRETRAVAILEMMPSLKCKYTGVTQTEETAVISCMYSNDTENDFRYDLFNKAEHKIEGFGFKKVQVLVGENSYYPNGRKSDFEKMGFMELRQLGKTYLLNRGYDMVWIMEKAIAER